LATGWSGCKAAVDRRTELGEISIDRRKELLNRYLPAIALAHKLARVAGRFLHEAKTASRGFPIWEMRANRTRSAMALRRIAILPRAARHASS
jgi:hypothetical protein